MTIYQKIQLPQTYDEADALIYDSTDGKATHTQIAPDLTISKGGNMRNIGVVIHNGDEAHELILWRKDGMIIVSLPLKWSPRMVGIINAILPVGSYIECDSEPILHIDGIFITLAGTTAGFSHDHE